MACNTLTNRSEPCKEFVGGLRGVWLIPYAYDNVITKDVSDLVTLITTSSDLVTPITAYFWELMGLSTLEISDTASQDNGNLSYQSTLTLSLKPSATTATAGEADNDLFDTLMRGRWQIIVWDRNDQFRLLGEKLGCDATTGTHSWGAQVGDARLNTITMVCTEKNPPALLDAAEPADVNGTIVTLSA